jgi:hypothetical protein
LTGTGAREFFRSDFDKKEIAPAMSSRQQRQFPVGQMNSPGGQVQDASEFDPEGSVLDYMTYTVVSYAIKNAFSPPFRLRFADANQSRFRESILRMKKDELWERVTFENSDPVQFPLCCRLTDRKGRKHEMVVSTEEMKNWIDASTTSGSRHIRFPGKLPAFAPEVYSNVRQLLVASCVQGLEPPFTVEIRDADGELFGTAEIYADDDGEFRGGRNIADCAHVKFPVTIRLISQSGAGLTTIVQQESLKHSGRNQS